MQQRTRIHRDPKRRDRRIIHRLCPSRADADADQRDQDARLVPDLAAVARFERITKQSPLRAIGLAIVAREIGGEIPPFGAKGGVGGVVLDFVRHSSTCSRVPHLSLQGLRRRQPRGCVRSGLGGIWELYATQAGSSTGVGEGYLTPFAFAQSALKIAIPLSVSGCFVICSSTFSGIVATCAPASADSVTWRGWRIDAARISQ